MRDEPQHRLPSLLVPLSPHLPDSPSLPCRSSQYSITASATSAGVSRLGGKGRETAAQLERQFADVGRVEVQAAQALHLLKNLARRTGEGDATLIQDHDAVGVHRFAHEVCHRHDRDALLAVEPPRNRQHFGAAQRVEHRRGLVQHQHVGLHRQHARNADALLLPAGKLMRGALAIGLHLHAVERPIDAAQNLRARHAQVFRAKGDILLDDGRHDLVVGVLEDHADRAANVAQAGALLGVPGFDPHVAAVGQQQRIEMLGQRRLARPIVSQQHDILALLDGQIDAAQRLARCDLSRW